MFTNIYKLQKKQSKNYRNKIFLLILKLADKFYLIYNITTEAGTILTIVVND